MSEKVTEVFSCASGVEVEELSLVGLSLGRSTTCGIRLESAILTWSQFGRVEGLMASFWRKTCSVFDLQ